MDGGRAGVAEAEAGFWGAERMDDTPRRSRMPDDARITRPLSSLVTEAAWRPPQGATRAKYKRPYIEVMKTRKNRTWAIEV
jgi:hypothetical protein